MVKSICFSRSFRIASILGVIVSGFAAPAAFAAGDKKPPTKPTNLRVTSVTAHNVMLAWNPSTDNSGQFSYRVFVSAGFTRIVSKSQTTLSQGVVPNNTYSFYVYAVDIAGNASARSNTVTVTTPRDTTPPSAPVVSLVDVNPTEVAVQWTASTDDGFHVFYDVYVNGSHVEDAGQNLSAVVHGLNPETTYEITVKARDLYGPNQSAPSNVLSVTTSAVSAVDEEAPSSPGFLFGFDTCDGSREIHLHWVESFDNQTKQASIVYEVYLNGVFDHQAVGVDRTILYATQGGENFFTVIAVDAAGNRSEPATISIFSQ